jgi:hypothetical protein
MNQCIRGCERRNGVDKRRNRCILVGTGDSHR